MGWKKYEFEIPLGLELPDKAISLGEDWLNDCEDDDVFELKPECFASKNKYDAALQLCRACGGWFYFENEEEKIQRIELLRKIVSADVNDPISYFILEQNCFDFIKALRDNNQRYKGKLYDVDSTWTLANMLSERSYLEKAECLEWLIDFFGEDLKYDTRNELQSSFINRYGSDLELLLLLRPGLIEKLTHGYSKASDDKYADMASAAAGLIRYGEEESGIELYDSIFTESVKTGSGRNIKQSIVEEFLERLSKGFEDEPYISEEIVRLIEEQLNEFSDGEWISKIRNILRRNRI